IPRLFVACAAISCPSTWGVTPATLTTGPPSSCTARPLNRTLPCGARENRSTDAPGPSTRLRIRNTSLARPTLGLNPVALAWGSGRSKPHLSPVTCSWFSEALASLCARMGTLCVAPRGHIERWIPSGDSCERLGRPVVVAGFREAEHAELSDRGVTHEAMPSRVLAADREDVVADPVGPRWFERHREQKPRRPRCSERHATMKYVRPVDEDRTRGT